MYVAHSFKERTAQKKRIGRDGRKSLRPLQAEAIHRGHYKTTCVIMKHDALIF